MYTRDCDQGLDAVSERLVQRPKGHAGDCADTVVAQITLCPDASELRFAGLVSLRMRAMASAVLLFVLNLIGLGLGPQLVVVLNDVLHAEFGAEAIRYSLLAIGMAKAWGALHSLWAARSLRVELDRAAATA